MSKVSPGTPPDPPERPLKIKICGLTEPRNIEEVSALEPDFAGYIFVKGSRRFVGGHPDPALFRIPCEHTARVGVFVNETVDGVRKIFETCLLDLVQLHGSESPAYCQQLVDAGIPVIKVVHAGFLHDIRQKHEGGRQKDRAAGLPDHYLGVAHYLLFDSGKSGSGGSGQPFDWSLLGEQSIPLPFLLGGGIGPMDAPRIRQLGHSALFGVDLNSRFECSPGIKDASLLRPFMEEIRKPIIRKKSKSNNEVSS